MNTLIDKMRAAHYATEDELYDDLTVFFQQDHWFFRRSFDGLEGHTLLTFIVNHVEIPHYILAVVKFIQKHDPEAISTRNQMKNNALAYAINKHDMVDLLINAGVLVNADYYWWDDELKKTQSVDLPTYFALNIGATYKSMIVDQIVSFRQPPGGNDSAAQLSSYFDIHVGNLKAMIQHTDYRLGDQHFDIINKWRRCSEMLIYNFAFAEPGRLIDEIKTYQKELPSAKVVPVAEVQLLEEQVGELKEKLDKTQRALNRLTKLVTELIGSEESGSQVDEYAGSNPNLVRHYVASGNGRG